MQQPVECLTQKLVDRICLQPNPGSQPLDGTTLKLQHGTCTCGEGELVGGVHALVWRIVQVYHELQELEEEDKGREEVQEIEREGQVEEKRPDDHDHGDDMKGLKRLEPQCMCR